MKRCMFLLLVAAAAVLMTSAVTAGSDVEVDTTNIRAGGTPVGDLVRIPVKRVKINDFIYFVSGLSNVYLINTSEGAVVVDTGFAHMAAKQMALLKEVAQGPVKYIFLPQGQHDDVGGLTYIREKDTQIIMLRESEAYMPWRKEIAPFLAPRYAVLYNWATQLGKAGDPGNQKKPRFPYDVLKADIVVASHEGYCFELGDVVFEIIALPGAEGTNSAGLWLPQHKVLFCGGGFVGPEFPMWPNIGTVRADKNRFMDAYLESLDKAIALEPEFFLPGQDKPFFGKEKILADLIKIRDAVQYVRNEVVKGLIQGKDVYRLMQEIRLPEHLADLSQQHGRMEWSIRSMVYHYGAWFQYRYTSELYPYRPTLMYPDLVELAGGVAPVCKRARQALANNKPVKAIQLVEAALETAPDDKQVLETQLQVLQALLKRAQETEKTFSEIAWLQAEITKVRRKLEG